MSPTPDPPAENEVPSELIDCAALFPAHGQLRDNKFSDLVSQRWLSKSAFTVATVGFLSKVFLKGLNSTVTYNREALVNAIENRPDKVPLITVANHHSCVDEPLLWGLLDLKHIFNQKLMRWSLAAHDICFTQRFHSLFFSMGKCIPICRGRGIYQQGMDFVVDRLNDGAWVHLFPEGKVNEEKHEMRLKWGIGRLIAESKTTPIVIPIYHQGMDSILPNRSPYIPRFLQRVTVVYGNPIPLEATLNELRSRGASLEEQRRELTSVVQFHLYKLKMVSEILHFRHVAEGIFHDKLQIKSL